MAFLGELSEAEYQEIRRTLARVLGRDDSSLYPDLPTDHALRGTPIVGRGRLSAITGTAPERALLAKEARGRLRLDFPDPLPRPEADSARPRTRKRLGRRVSAPSGRHF
jgi:hypothetical protein